MLLGVVAPHFMSGWLESLGGFLGYGKAAYWEQNTVDGTLRSLMGLAMETLSPVALLMAAVVAAALGTGIVQTGGIKIHPQVLGLKLERANPLANLRNLFSLRSTARLGKSMVPASFLTIFAVQRVAHQWDIPPFATVRLISLGRDVYELLLAAAWLLFCWALIDYFVEWRSREKRLKMSRQEMREEYKDSEGNPQIRGRIKNLQRQARRRRVKADVSRAAVIVTNPTHYAVALDFNFETMEAPRVLAKGRNLLAEEIKDEARWAGIPIMENPPLTRSLYRSVETGQSIPVELYAAVASILAFLYRKRVESEMRFKRQNTDAQERPKQNPPATGASIRSSRPKSGRGSRGSLEASRRSTTLSHREKE
jgi:flagellar biosynthetic protein FlhB